jgi:hypothetical protein
MKVTFDFLEYAAVKLNRLNQITKTGVPERT